MANLQAQASITLLPSGELVPSVDLTTGLGLEECAWLASQLPTLTEENERLDSYEKSNMSYASIPQACPGQRDFGDGVRPDSPTTGSIMPPLTLATQHPCNTNTGTEKRPSFALDAQLLPEQGRSSATTTPAALTCLSPCGSSPCASAPASPASRCTSIFSSHPPSPAPDSDSYRTFFSPSACDAASAGTQLQPSLPCPSPSVRPLPTVPDAPPATCLPHPPTASLPYQTTSSRYLYSPASCSSSCTSNHSYQHPGLPTPHAIVTSPPSTTPAPNSPSTHSSRPFDDKILDKPSTINVNTPTTTTSTPASGMASRVGPTPIPAGDDSRARHSSITTTAPLPTVDSSPGVRQRSLPSLHRTLQAAMEALEEQLLLAPLWGCGGMRLEDQLLMDAHMVGGADGRRGLVACCRAIGACVQTRNPERGCCWLAVGAFRAPPTFPTLSLPAAGLQHTTHREALCAGKYKNVREKLVNDVTHVIVCSVCSVSSAGRP